MGRLLIIAVLAAAMYGCGDPVRDAYAASDNALRDATEAWRAVQSAAKDAEVAGRERRLKAEAEFEKRNPALSPPDPRGEGEYWRRLREDSLWKSASEDERLGRGLQESAKEMIERCSKAASAAALAASDPLSREMADTESDSLEKLIRGSDFFMIMQLQVDSLPAGADLALAKSAIAERDRVLAKFPAVTPATDAIDRALAAAKAARLSRSK